MADGQIAPWSGGLAKYGEILLLEVIMEGFRAFQRKLLREPQ